MNKLFITFALFGLAGCATTTTGPTPSGQDQYVMSRQEGAFPSGSEPLLQEVLEQANKFCQSLDKSLEVLDTHENQGPFILGNYPKATIRFKCL
ncbi:MULTISPECIES: hypothetical protein [unclassified Photobacterium]|uniref:hypothetical protein n=1 Tax=unclassified Photobacterium TaxID=2628852 RepID=UPI000D15B2AC|nr:MULTISPECIES: hypothetical protein [unclassified Photobacterium]PSV21478.1 hypothetical protein C9J42_20915 [Photobacterium sp. GB-56]PSV33701.1 hypothetical protein C9J38_20135 [Photobacterium sp. GB-210]PSV38636.1 hypothetical protein C9J46_20780 [Photobacterium sp. GB-36]PSV50241.1 hypothetical protein C9J45_21035 [Photobacterium sp. GB-1]PSV57327.1 hypothetical protein C9J43_06970 [Photobacterium sp. GB-3]